MELGKDRRVAFCLVVFLVSRPRDLDEPDLLEARELPMHSARSAPCQTDELCALEAAVGLPEEQRKYALLHWRKESVGEAGAATGACSHFGYDHTHNGNDRKSSGRSLICS